MPASLRRTMRRAERRSLRESRVVRFGVFQFDGSESGGYFGDDLADLRRGRSTFTVPHGGRSDVSGLVPDGVASVDVSFVIGPGQSATVTNNLWTVDAPGVGRMGPAKTVWKAADGTVIGSFRGTKAAR